MVKEERKKYFIIFNNSPKILEWVALSRLTGNPIYEEKARKAMDFLWNQRHRGSDLMGTVLNVNSGLSEKMGFKNQKKIDIEIFSFTFKIFIFVIYVFPYR
jgi:hypothetical protein